MLSFRRIISSGKFIPEIDGLRFLAIASVLMHHLTTFIHLKDTHVYVDQIDYSTLKDLGWKGFFGVQLFFVISGFVLALPFARMHFKQGESVNIKNYLLRRLTRLEPPYIVVMTVLLLATIYIVGKLQPGEALASYCSSLLYIHNFVYGKGTHPLLNTVAWSLEIEVQFYLLAPLLGYVFKIVNARTRRILLCIAILLSTVITPWIPFPFISLANYIQYFLTGFLLADFYLLKPAEPPAKNIGLELLGLLCMAGIWLFNGRTLEWKTAVILWQLLQLLLVFGFYYVVLVAGKCAWIRASVLTSIGGMCYTIYLIHYPIISMVGNPLLSRTFSAYSYVNLGIVVIVLLATIMLCSGAFYLLVERPCMDKRWPQKLTATVKQFFN